jgi:hypothetical protein
MVMMRIFLLLVAAMLAGCRGSFPLGQIDSPSELLYNRIQTPAAENVRNGKVTVTIGDVNLVMDYPAEWELFTTEHGVVLAEHIGSIALDDQLGGLLLYVMVPPLQDFTLPTAESQNQALTILHDITGSAEYIGSATATEPVGFQWSGHEAAYYLINNGEGSLSLVLGVYLAEEEKFIACSMSAPVGQAERIRELLPVLLDGLTINGTTLDNAALLRLPDPLDFPEHKPPEPE